MSSNQTQFESSLDAFLQQEVNAAIIREFKRFVLKLFVKIIKRTPVDIGRFRASWAFDLINDGFEAEPGLKTSVYNHIARMNNEALQAKIDQIKDPRTMPGMFWIFNNLPYGEELEYGHSRIKAPQGMVRLAIAEMLGLFE